jgi:hypothetical protein
VGTLTGPQNVDVYSVVETNEGQIIVVGDWNANAWLSEIDSAGNLRVNKTYANLDFFTSCLAEKNNQFLLSASTVLPHSNQRYTVDFVKIDQNLNIISTKACPSDSILYQLKKDLAGNYVALSWHTYVTDSSDLKGYLMGFDVNGKLLWNVTLIGATAGSALFSSKFALTKEGYVVTGAQYSDGENQQNIFMQKIRMPSAPLPSPSVPELYWLVILSLLLSVFAVAVILRHRKTASSVKRVCPKDSLFQANENILINKR